MMNQFVRDVFISRNQDKYLELLRIMREGEDEKQAIDILSQIRLYCPQLAENHENYKDLLEMLFSFDWGVSEDVAEAFEEILIALNLANAAFLEETFGLIVRNFTAVVEGNPEHLHALIRRVLRVTPLGCSALLNVLIQNFPQKSNSLPIGTQLLYFREALKVTEYVPVLRDRVVGIAIERVLDLDIELAFFDENDDDENENNIEEIKRIKLESDVSEVKLDTLLGGLLDWFETAQKKQLAFKSILLQFDRLILRTKRSRCTQFLVFFASAQGKQYCEAFLCALQKKIHDTSEDIATRRYACGYLASFLARANFISHDTVCNTLKETVEWLLLQKPCLVCEAAFQAVIYAIIYKSTVLPEHFLSTLSGWDAYFAKHAATLPRDLAHEFALCMGQPHTLGSSSRQMEMIDFPFDPLVLLEQSWKRVEPNFQFWQHVDDEEEFESDFENDSDDGLLENKFEEEDEEEEDESESEDEDDEEEEEDDEEEFADDALLDAVLPKAIQIKRIERMLSANSPHVRPCLAAVPPPTIIPTVRKRSLSTGSW